ncbi:MAG TPA: DUF3024 domain-containing protein [Sulfurovum sp.]|nr:DUF3024 domain-containing protein [Sulfurovum sp.]
MIPPIQKQLAIMQMEKYCKNRIPVHAQHQVKSKYVLEKNTITLMESRVKWNDESIWIDIPIAKMKYEAKSMTWKLYCVRENGKWVSYEGLEPQKDLQECIDEVELDPMYVFGG